MPEIKSQPKLLKDVVQAMVDLCERRGSTMEHIIDQVCTNIALSNRHPKPRNVAMQVRRVLRHGIETGLLRQQSRGRYKIFFTNLATKTRIINSANKYRLDTSRYFEMTKRKNFHRLSARGRQKNVVPINFKKPKKLGSYKYQTTLRRSKHTARNRSKRRAKRRYNLGNRAIINKPKKQGPPGAIYPRNVTMDGDKKLWSNSKKRTYQKVNTKSFLSNMYNALNDENDKTDKSTDNEIIETQTNTPSSELKIINSNLNKNSSKIIEPNNSNNSESMNGVSELYRNEDSISSPNSDRSCSYII